MLLLDNPIQPYAWGRSDGIAELVGTAPTGGPEAELWVGTHPRGPSLVAEGEHRGRSLAEVVAGDPARWLGPALAAEGLTALPYLLKVLAIGEPLSLQAHPSAEQAAAGFAREDAAGIDVDAPERSYRDTSAKPEVLVSLVTSAALCGFRPPGEAAALVREVGAAELEPLARCLDGAAVGQALHDALAWLLQLREPQRSAVAVAAAVAAADRTSGEMAPGPGDPWAWVAELAQQHPGDPGCLAPLLLQIVELAAGQAVHLPAGNLHAYLSGGGVEIMAASDNVLRGGLTPKHIDVDELLHVLRFEPGVPAAPRRSERGALTTYDAGEHAFALACITPTGAATTAGGAGRLDRRRRAARIGRRGFRLGRRR